MQAQDVALLIQEALEEVEGQQNNEREVLKR